jgi:Recombinase/UvrD-like helicase C-terminal domain
VNPDDAKIVVRLFHLYLELGCVSKLKARLDQEGIKSKERTSAAGNQSGGTSYCRGALYQILKNRIYLGEIPHRGQNHPGEHAAIVQRELWDQVQTGRFEFNASEQRHFDHGYAVTSHSSQGLTAERVLVHADTSVHSDLLNSRFGYVSISRASHSATVFTDDMAKLGPQLGADVSKTSALELSQTSSAVQRIGIEI